MAFPKFDLENPRSRSWVRWNFIISRWVRLNSDPFHSMSIRHPFPVIWLFQHLTLKVQGQRHRSSTHGGLDILSTKIPFLPCQSTLPFLIHSFLNLYHWKSKVKVVGEVQVHHNKVRPTAYQPIWFSFNWLWSRSYRGANILSPHIRLVPWHLTLPLLGNSFFKIWPWKSQVKVIAQGHIVGLTSFRLTSLLFHDIRSSHSWDIAF